MQALVLVMLDLLPCLLASQEMHWRYGKTVYDHGTAICGPVDWKNVSAHCVENTQSPVNIKTDKNSMHMFPYLDGFHFIVDNMVGSVSGVLVNNGHAPTLIVDQSKTPAILTGGPWANKVYMLKQLHFHFGCDASKGSEHTVDGRVYSGELHLVTYNTKYFDFHAAADKPDGLSVVAVFFLDNGGDESNWEQLTDAMKKITKADSITKVPMYYIKLYHMVPQLRDLSRASFYTYKGSLTTPPCYQSVKWIVLENPVSTSREVMTAMRSLKNHEGHSLCDNFRPTQPLNGRLLAKHSRY
ncbi:carbonic anhydrase 2-like isoform X1 [Orbicella faveolata]|uniref:carbonic anhydrase 2-like isoform X1 n=2 Tax=Orbicella faveolata TaxID=48498 RepID=UPI0009E375EF|nr:carbonic anhydrase 2-like isoform X1 [Orbicella faveolata]